MYIFFSIYGSFCRIVNISCLVFIFAQQRLSACNQCKFHFNFKQKGKNLEGVEAAVSLSLDHVLSEYHLLSKTSACLASKRNLEENLSCQHALSVSSARQTRSLSLLALSANMTLSQNSFIRAKRENGTKRAFEDRKPFLSLK